jgi:hypothetical protein
MGMMKIAGLQDCSIAGGDGTKEVCRDLSFLQSCNSDILQLTGSHV